MNTDDRRMLLAIVLSMAVFLGYQAYLSKKYPPASRRPASVAGLAGQTDTHALTDTRPAEARPVPQPAMGLASAASDDREDTEILQGGVVEVVTTTRGAGVRQIRLHGIPRHPHKDERNVILVDEGAPEPHGAIHLPGLEGVPNFKKIKSAPDHVTYAYEAPLRGGLRIERTITLTPNPYEIRLKTRIRNLSGQAVQYGTDSSTAIGYTLASFPKKERPRKTGFFDRLFGTELDVHELFIKLGEDVENRKEDMKSSLRQSETLEGVLRWLSLGDRYFCVTLIPDSALARAHVTTEGPSISVLAQYGVWTVAAGGEKILEESLYAGPKIPDHLRRYGKDLLDVMNFGWFDWLGFGMLWLMNVFHRAIPNYGVAIILLTVIVRVVLYPLTYKSYVSMVKLKELTPKMKVVQEKYKDNKEKLNKELLKLYKDNKVNPAGGCLPILLQIPVFIAFYRMLQYAIELRGASFLWCPDLSEKDPFYILPVLMGAAMLVQQKLTPTPDPNQAKIGMFMTVMFTFMFLAFPSGLNLYWFVSTLLGLVQQKFIERKLKHLNPTPTAAEKKPV